MMGAFLCDSRSAPLVSICVPLLCCCLLALNGIGAATGEIFKDEPRVGVEQLDDSIAGTAISQLGVLCHTGVTDRARSRHRNTFQQRGHLSGSCKQLSCQVFLVERPPSRAGLLARHKRPFGGLM